MGDGGGHWLVRMEWRPAGWSVCHPLLIFLCTIKSRSSRLALAHPGSSRKGAVIWLWWLDQNTPQRNLIRCTKSIHKLSLFILAIKHWTDGDKWCLTIYDADISKDKKVHGRDALTVICVDTEETRDWCVHVVRCVVCKHDRLLNTCLSFRPAHQQPNYISVIRHTMQPTVNYHCLMYVFCAWKLMLGQLIAW